MVAHTDAGATILHIPPFWMKLSKQSKDGIVFEKVSLMRASALCRGLFAVTRIEDTDTCIGFFMDTSERKELEKRKDIFHQILCDHSVKGTF
jgi:hypothetical protein